MKAQAKRSKTTPPSTVNCRYSLKAYTSIEKNVILEALNNVTKALSQRTTIPVLNGIVFDVSNEAVSYTHLDVYKRQVISSSLNFSNLCFL